MSTEKNINLEGYFGQEKYFWSDISVEKNILWE
jgi:hypothetical protein